MDHSHLAHPLVHLPFALGDCAQLADGEFEDLAFFLSGMDLGSDEREIALGGDRLEDGRRSAWIPEEGA